MITLFKEIILLLFSCSDMSDSLRPHRLQHTRLPCSLPSPRVYSNSCPLNWCCHPIISIYVIPLPSCLQSFPASGSVPMSWLFPSGGQSIGVSASESVLLMNIQDWFSFFKIGCFDLFAVQGTLKSLPKHHSSKAPILVLSLHYGPALISVHNYWKNHIFDYTALCHKSLLFVSVF